MRGLAGLVIAGALAPSLASAEQVVLKSGGRVEGVLVERTTARVVLQVGPGLVTLPVASIERIVESRSPLLAFEERAARLAGTDREGWLDLALWARDRGLETQAHEGFARVLALDPQNALAQAGIGNVLLNGRWVTPEESYRSQGYVRFEGSWMLPEERDETLRDRAERRAEARARAESEARVAEAEARARAEEAAARRSEAENSGIPFGYLGGGYGPYGYGYGYGYGNGYRTRGTVGQPSGAPHPGRHPTPTPEPTQAPTASWGPRAEPRR